MKSYTDIDQSKKSAEILPIESADMHYEKVYFEGKQSNWFVQLGAPVKSNDIIPCWSLAALLEQLPYEMCNDDGNSSYLHIDKEDDVYQLLYEDPYGDFENIETDRYEHFVDACVAMIIKLNEQNFYNMDYEKKYKEAMLVEQNAILQELKALHLRMEHQTVCNDAGGNRMWSRAWQNVNEAIDIIQRDKETYKW